MKLYFYGAARTTTGSMHVVETNSQRILLDCGLYQDHRDEAFARNSHLPFDPKTINTAFLSHAHIDHSGNLPTLIKNGFAGEVNCTTATRDLATLMLRDSLHAECLREELRDHLLSHDDPFGFGGLKYTRMVDESKAINTIRDACVIISANGMCEAGRILHHLKNNIEDACNTLLFVGYQAENTLGRRLLDGAKK